jgi:hypothetical protein
MFVLTVRDKTLIRFSRYITPIISIVFCLILLCAEKRFLDNRKIIGTIGHPGLQGEILFQKNIIYNSAKGNTFKYFNTDYLNYPFGENLGFAIANSLYLFMYIPLRFLFGIIESYNILVIIIFLSNFIAAYLLAKYLFSSRAVAFCSALIFALNPYVLLKLNEGFIQKSIIFWIPLYCLVLFKLQNTKHWRYVFLAGIVLCLMQLTYPPYAYYCAIFTIVLLSYVFLKREELRFAFSRFVFIIILLIVFTSSVYYLMGFRFVYFKMYHPTLNTALDGCLDLFKPFHFFPYRSSYYPADLPLGISISAFVLAIIALIKKEGLPRLIFINFLFFTIIAAGPYLTYNNQPIQLLGHKISLPFYFIAKYLPFAGGIFFPMRVFPFINICLALLAGYGLLYFSSIVKKIKPLMIATFFSLIYLLENIVLFPQIFPPKFSEVYIPKFYQQIKNEHFEAVLNLPISSNRKIINLYGFYTALSGKKIMNPYDKNELQIFLPENTDEEQRKTKFVELLSSWNVGYVIVHRNFLQRGIDGKPIDRFSWLKSFCEFAFYPEDNLLVYKIPVFSKAHENINFKGKTITVKSQL